MFAKACFLIHLITIACLFFALAKNSLGFYSKKNPPRAGLAPGWKTA
jgi:hypothetical protein